MDKIISLLNPWWRDGTVRPELRKDFIRDAFGECWGHMETRQVVVISGLRRVGKTTIIYQMIEKLIRGGADPENILYFSFDERRDGIRHILEEYASSLGKDIEKGRYFVFLDEIQKHAGWTDELKLLYDALPGIKFVVSGSAALHLEKRGRESLAGRIFFTRVEPLSFGEWLRMRGVDFKPEKAELFENRIKPRLLEYMSTPFPEIIDWKGERVRKYIKETIVERAVFRDIPQEFGDADHSLLEDLLQIFYSNPGAYLNVDSLAMELGRSKLTIRNHIHYLRFSFLIRMLGNYRGSRRSASRKMRRIYPYCPALSAGEDAELPRLVENLVVSALGAESYWRERDSEVDAVCGGLPIEVKYKNKIDSHDLRGLRSCMKMLGLRRGIVVSKDSASSLKEPEGDIEIEPAWKFLVRPDSIAANGTCAGPMQTGMSGGKGRRREAVTGRQQAKQER